MLKLQRLFGPRSEGSDLLGHTPFLERARRERQRADDVSSRLALAAYAVARLLDRLLDDAHPEIDEAALRWQAGSTRRAVAELPASSAETAHLGGIVRAADPDDPRWRAAVRLNLQAYAFFLEQEARLDEALDIVALVVRTYGDEVPPDEYTTLGLTAGRLSRLLAHWEEAKLAYACAGEAAELAGDRAAALLARLGRANVLRGQGNLPESRAECEAIIAEAAACGHAEVEARAYADLGVVFERLGQRAEALEARYEAFLRMQDPLQRMRILGDLGVSLSELGAFDVARIAFELVTESNTSVLVRANAHIELMTVEARCGNRLAFERHRQLAPEVTGRMPPSMAVDYRFQAGVALAGFGQESRARALLLEARAIAEEHQLHQWYFRVDEVLATLGQARPKPEAPRAVAAAYVPSVSRLEAGLREYAAAQAG